MSKRNQFKALLNDNGSTGSQQKEHILSTHLLPPKSNDNIPLPEMNVDEGTDGQNVSDEDTNRDSTNSAMISSESPENQTNGIQANESVEQSAPESLSSSDLQPLTESKQVDNSITNLVSSLTNMVELNVEDTHTRATYLIENDLLAELKKVSEGKKKGYKTKVVNAGIRIVLDLMKQDKGFKL